MRLGIFGDSYADENLDLDYRGWPGLLSKLSEFSIVNAQCGTSHYWAYKKFLEEVRTNNLTHVIFCHTNPYRWPCLPEELEGNNWNIHSVKNSSLNETLTLLNNYYYDLFPERFSDFISRSIFKEVNEYCKTNNIFLINITSFDDVRLYNTQKHYFPIFYDIDKVSSLEKIRYKNKEYSYRQIVENFHVGAGDPRSCHLGKTNNKRVADILYPILVNKNTNLVHNMSKDFEWDIYDPSNDNLFAEHIAE